MRERIWAVLETWASNYRKPNYVGDVVAVCPSALEAELAKHQLILDGFPRHLLTIEEVGRPVEVGEEVHQKSLVAQYRMGRPHQIRMIRKGCVECGFSAAGGSVKGIRSGQPVRRD